MLKNSESIHFHPLKGCMNCWTTILKVGVSDGSKAGKAFVLVGLLDQLGQIGTHQFVLMESHC